MEYNVGILGIGVHIPEHIVTNQEMAERFGVSERAIVRKTGVIERRYESPETTLADMCVIAALRAIEDAGVSREDIELVVVATNTHDTYITSALVQDRIGAKKCAGFDLIAGCSSFITGFTAGSQFVQTGLYQNALVIAVDKCSSIIDPDDKQTALLFADGASAVVVGRVPKDKGILGIEMQVDGSGGKYLHLDENHHIFMDGEAVYDFATECLPKAIQSIVDIAKIDLSQVDFIIPHQANLKIIEKGMRELDYPMDNVHTYTVQYYGNSSAPTIPIGLHHELQKGSIKDGDIILLVGYGAGLGWGSVALRWGR